MKAYEIIKPFVTMEIADEWQNTDEPFLYLEGVLFPDELPSMAYRAELIEHLEDRLEELLNTPITRVSPCCHLDSPHTFTDDRVYSFECPCGKQFSIYK